MVRAVVATGIHRTEKPRLSHQGFWGPDLPIWMCSAGPWVQGMGALRNNPEFMQQMMNSPMMQSMLADPELMRSILSQNPAISQVGALAQNSTIGGVRCIAPCVLLLTGSVWHC